MMATNISTFFMPKNVAGVNTQDIVSAKAPFNTVDSVITGKAIISGLERFEDSERLAAALIAKHIPFAWAPITPESFDNSSALQDDFLPPVLHGTVETNEKYAQYTGQ
jgi:hypothetical protein